MRQPLITAIVFLFLSASLHAQWEPPMKQPTKPEKNKSSANIRGRFGIGGGVCFDPEMVPITDIACRVLTSKVKFLIDARFQAFGNKSVINGNNYDFVIYGHRVKSLVTNFTFFYGGGVGASLRNSIVDYVPGRTDVQVMAVTGSMFYKGKVFINCPIWAKFGLREYEIAILPEPSYKFHPKAQVFLRYQAGFHGLYNNRGFRLRQDAVLGMYFYFS